MAHRLTVAQWQLEMYVRDTATDPCRGMAPSAVLRDLIAGYEIIRPGRGREELADAWGLTLEQLDEVAALFAVEVSG